MIRPLQTRTFPSIGTQQATVLPTQSSVLPAQTDTSIDITSLFNLMITMMIVMMMMNAMTKMMEKAG